MLDKCKFRATNIGTSEQWEFEISSSDYMDEIGRAKRKATIRWPDGDIDLALFDDHDTKKYKTNYEKRNGKWFNAWRPHEVYNFRATNLHTGEQWVDMASNIMGAKQIASRQYPNSDIHIAWFDAYVAIYESEEDWTSYTKRNGKWELSPETELIGMLARQEDVVDRSELESDDDLGVSADEKFHQLADGKTKKTISLDKVVILDTETTGLGKQAEICEIAMIDGNGKVLLNTLVKPTHQIPKEATAIHNITNKMVADAPSWSDIHSQFCKIIKGKNLHIYNAEYDIRLIKQTIVAQDQDWFKQCKEDEHMSAMILRAGCIMLKYAKYKGDPSKHHVGYKRHKLKNAARQCNIPSGKTHRALADCKIALGILQYMQNAHGYTAKPVSESELKPKSTRTKNITIALALLILLYLALR